MTNEEAKRKVRGYLTDILPSDCSDEIDEIMQALEPKWIPVSEKLPTADEDVLITNGRGMHVGWFDSVAKCWLGDFESEYFTNNIIAWMPLPESYKEEDEE